MNLKLARPLFVFCAVLLLVGGCARYTVKATEDPMPGKALSGYRYVHVPPPAMRSTESDEEANVRPQVEKELAGMGFEVLGKSAFARLADEERPLALTCSVKSEWRLIVTSRVTLELLDWQSERVFSVTGEAQATGIATSTKGELSRATDAALAALAARYAGPGAEPDTTGSD